MIVLSTTLMNLSLQIETIELDLVQEPLGISLQSNTMYLELNQTPFNLSFNENKGDRGEKGEDGIMIEPDLDFLTSLITTNLAQGI